MSVPSIASSVQTISLIDNRSIVPIAPSFPIEPLKTQTKMRIPYLPSIFATPQQKYKLFVVSPVQYNARKITHQLLLKNKLDYASAKRPSAKRPSVKRPTAFSRYSVIPVHS